MSSDEVNEATAALKGLLGIGSATGSKDETETTTPVKEEQTKKKKKTKKSSKKKKKQAKDGGAKAKQQHDGSEKFAWSAFQASPDPSALPIPAFSPEATKKTATVDEGAATTTVAPPPEALANAPKAEDVEAEAISQAEKKKDEVKPVEETKEEEAALPVSSGTGVNLAALAASTPTNKTDAQQTITPTPRHTAPSQAGTQPTAFSQQQQQHTPPAYNAYSNPQQQRQPHYPPQRFVTIQVQVPPVLGPGRQMLVASPMGYPVQITVPEGVPPGMVIPVHVPAPPPAPHMMPPPGGTYPYGHPPAPPS